MRNIGKGQTLHFGRAELKSCIRRDQHATFNSVEFGSFKLRRPQLVNSPDAVAFCDTRAFFGSKVEISHVLNEVHKLVNFISL